MQQVSATATGIRRRSRARSTLAPSEKGGREGCLPCLRHERRGLAHPGRTAPACPRREKGPRSLQGLAPERRNSEALRDRCSGATWTLHETSVGSVWLALIHDAVVIDTNRRQDAREYSDDAMDKGDV